jgi:hypothetical protein
MLAPAPQAKSSLKAGFFVQNLYIDPHLKIPSGQGTS